MDPESLTLSERPDAKDHVSFLEHAGSRTGQSTDTDRTERPGAGSGECLLHGYNVSFLSGFVLNGGDGCLTLCIKHHGITHLNMVHFLFCEFFLNKSRWTLWSRQRR